MARSAQEAAVRAALELATPVAAGGAFVRVLERGALAAARAADRRGGEAPLAGVTLAVKDLLAVAGCPIGAGSASRAAATAEPADAAVVAALKRAGATVVGTVALHELAFGVTGVNPYQGTPANPLSPGAIPGGSSSGSAVAVATGGAALAIGSDTGGSCRIPAAFCGVVGFKPALGEYPTEGMLALAPTLDHVGLLARDVDHVRRAHSGLGLDAGEVCLPRRVGVDAGAIAEAAAPVAVRVGELLGLLERHGAVLSDVVLPELVAARRTATTVMLAEAARVHAGRYADDPGSFGEDVAARLRAGLELEEGEYEAALAEAERLRDATIAALSGFELVVGPTVGRLAPGIEDATERAVSGSLGRNTIVHNLAGSAALSLPLPGDAGVGAQLAGRSSAAVLGAAAAIEALLR